MVPLDGKADSQAAPELVATLKARAAPLLPSDTDCVAGAVPPVWKVKVSADGLTMNTRADDTLRVTLTT